MTSTLPVPVLATPPAPPTSPVSIRPAQPRWVRPALLALLASTAVLYLWGLGASGWANAFYSAAAQAGSVSWKAFFFGSSDAANSITVDKTPGALWIMDLSARIFGVNAWSLLVPQALMGVATVGLLFATVRRWFGPAAGLIAGAVCALTPVAVLMFRFNNPDASLVLLMVAGAYATVRAIENGSTKWLVLAGVFVGFGFLSKMLQALLVVPAYGLAYLLFGPPRLGRRIGQLLLAGLAVVVSAGWYIAIVELVPASMRPYIGGSQNNSLLELTLGYNGLGRLSGNETGSVGGGAGGPGGGRWGVASWLRMFDPEQAGQISWLLPAALILLVTGLALTARAARTDLRRAGLVLWGGWLVITAAVFSFMQGIFHAYYTVALAPAIGAVVGMGAVMLWRERRTWWGAGALAAAIGVTAWWSYHLLSLSPSFVPGLRFAVLISGLAAAAGVLAGGLLPAGRPTPDSSTVDSVPADSVPADSIPAGSMPAGSMPADSMPAGSMPAGGRRMAARVAAIAAGVGLAAGVAGPAAYAVQTAAQPHTGSIPSAGPRVAGAFGGPGGFRGGGQGRGFPGGGFPGGGAFPAPPGGTTPGGTTPGGTTPGGTTGTAPGTTGTPPGGAMGGGNRGGGMGGLLDAATVSTEMKALLEQNADAYTWVAAAVGSQSASGYQLATGKPVMPIGGFNGSDPSPTLAQFQQYVSAGKIHYFIGNSGPGGRSNGGSNASAAIASWVAENFTARTVGNTTVYDLTK